MDREAVYLYLLCFVHDRYQRLNDGLIPIWAGRLLLAGAPLRRRGACRHQGGHPPFPASDQRRCGARGKHPGPVPPSGHRRADATARLSILRHTDIDAAVHSTDTHGTNHVNFALLHQFAYRFAPRYRNARRQANSGLFGFRHPRHYDKDWPIRPNGRVREGLIRPDPVRGAGGA